jgi:phosphopantetheine adenylyltransferase
MKKIAFIPGAFRPFGSHHMKMVEHYSKMCDEVIIIVSNP